jgi:radical SAM-linked protein
MTPVSPPHALEDIRVRYETVLERVRNPARLLGIEPGAGPGFGSSSASGREGRPIRSEGEEPDGPPLRFVVAFPDAYEIGISNQALQILYHLAEGLQGVMVERAYVPWVDVSEELRAEGLPLLTWETWTPVVSADVLGVTIQHELNYTNVLELLDLAQVPLRADDRGPEHPLVVAGGPAMPNFAPLAPYFDAFAVGDGEELLPPLLSAVRRGRLGGDDRQTVKRALADIRGIYVPGESVAVTRVARPKLTGSPYPVGCLVPLTAGVHDRAWIEVMRGCTRGCRFCQAGMWYRPVRERPSAEVAHMALTQIAASGHEELALGSLSTTDYSGLGPLLALLGETLPEVRVGLPSLRVDSAAVRLSHLVSPKSRSLTLAPEAATQRLRDVINKNVEDADIAGAAREAFGVGYTNLKLYFMIGLPTETDEDVTAMLALCRRLKELGREALGKDAGRLKLHVSVTNFIPKPLTPFQWEPMADRETLERRQGILRGGLRRMGVQLDLHDIEASYLEAALARGGTEMAAVVERAFRLGARFDSWTEQARPEAWRQAFIEAGLSAEALATRAIPLAAGVPWDVIFGGVPTRGFLVEERDRAYAGVVSPDCREGECLACGACEGNVQGDVYPGGRGLEEPALERAQVCFPPQAVDRGAGRTPVRGLWAVLEFSVRGRARFLAHLDTLEALRRSVRRAGGRLALSQGMRPKPLLSLALPRAVGVESEAEYCEFGVAVPPPPDFEERLRDTLPQGFHLQSLTRCSLRPHLAGSVVAAVYKAGVEGAQVGRLAQAAELYSGLSECIVVREKPGSRREVDVRAYVEEVAVTSSCGTQPGGERCTLVFRAVVSPQGTVRPEEVVTALAGLSGLEEGVIRVKDIVRVEVEFRDEVDE